MKHAPVLLQMDGSYKTIPLDDDVSSTVYMDFKRVGECLDCFHVMLSYLIIFFFFLPFVYFYSEHLFLSYVGKVPQS